MEGPSSTDEHRHSSTPQSSVSILLEHSSQVLLVIFLPYPIEHFFSTPHLIRGFSHAPTTFAFISISDNFVKGPICESINIHQFRFSIVWYDTTIFPNHFQEVFALLTVGWFFTLSYLASSTTSYL